MGMGVAMYRSRPTIFSPPSYPRSSAVGSLTVWLSTTPAGGLASRPTRFRDGVRLTRWSRLVQPESVVECRGIWAMRKATIQLAREGERPVSAFSVFHTTTRHPQGGDQIQPPPQRLSCQHRAGSRQRRARGVNRWL